ncbi:MAG TPA: hypothetical protein VNC41_15540 [Acidimicrobiia bacterium]|nr:hypothetical protein [Acidimicrobiia bacterium]
MSAATHPLEMLAGAEIERATEVLRASGRVAENVLFASMVLHEPDKTDLAQWKAGDPVTRRVRATVVPGPENLVIEAVVNVTSGECEQWDEIPDVRPTLLMTEAMNAIFTIKENPDYLAALAKRGITDQQQIDDIQIDPWPAGALGYAAEEGRRISRCISFVREHGTDNGYARPPATDRSGCRRSAAGR